MGAPVIAADHGATRETVAPGETGWLAKPGDVEAWTRGRADAGGCPAPVWAPRPAVAIARTAASAAADVALPTIVCILADSQT